MPYHTPMNSGTYALILGVSMATAGALSVSAIIEPKSVRVSQAKIKCPYCGTSNAAKAKACTSCKGNLDFVTFPKGTRLTKTSERDIQPCWSDDGKKIAYSSSQRGDFIFVMSANGTNPVKIPSSMTMGDYQPTFGPDGKIAFVGSMVSTDIFVMDADGSNRKRLEDFSATDQQPDWNAKGKIVFSSDRGGIAPYNLYVIDPAGGEATQLTKDAGSNYNPCWSPDGSKIAFNSDRDGNHDIYVMNADGSNVKRITNNPASDTDPSWGPDGRIAFVSNRGTSPDIFIMNADGSGQKQLTNNKWDDLWPCLGPEGKIVFQSRRDEGSGHQEDIYIIQVSK
jgi:Tol biopolymer transport system component